MKIGIDLKPFSTGSKYRGIGMYSRSLIKEMLQINNFDEYHFLNLYEKYDGDPRLNENCVLHQYNMGPQITDVGERQVFCDEKLENVVEASVKHFLEKSQIDVMLFTSPVEYGNMFKAEWFESIFKVGILYDLIPLVFPEQCLFNKQYAKAYYQALDFLSQMDLLLAISQSAKDDAVKLLHIPEEKIVVIHAGIDKEYKILPKVNVKQIKEKYGISDSFIMFAGGIDFKKNIEDLIAAYSKCGKKITDKYQFVIVGKTAEDNTRKFIEIAKKHGVQERVICTGYIPLEDLIELYNITDLLVFPSLYEGFGLPVIEAMACGARVVTSNCSSLKEIAEGYATLVNPKSINSITNGIKWVFDHPIDSMDMADSAIEYAKSFTWEKVAEKTVKAICDRCTENERVKYSFRVNEQIAREIARSYKRNKVNFSMSDRIQIAEQLLCIERHEDGLRFNTKNRILFDVTVVHEWMRAEYSTGIGRVSKELYKELCKRILTIPVVVSGSLNNAIVKPISLDTFTIADEEIEIDSKDIFFMPEIQLRDVQVGKHHPCINCIREKGAKAYAVVYDILPLRMPEYFEKATSRNFDKYIKEIINNYDGILCDSQFVADDIISYCSENDIVAPGEFKYGFFHLGQDTFEKKNQGHISGEIKRFFDNTGNVYLMIGTVEPRKGHELILGAFERMWMDGFEGKLCIMGHVGWNMNAFIERIKNHPYYDDKIVFFEGVSDSEVEYAYEHANCLIQASAGEGFGLPLIEASNYNLPILCSDIAVFHEVAGEHVNYFDRNSQENIIETINMFENGEGIVEPGCIEQTSWNMVAKKVYEMIVDDENWYKR